MGTRAKIVFYSKADAAGPRWSYVHLDGHPGECGSFLIDFVRAFGFDRSLRDLVDAAPLGWTILGGEHAASPLPKGVAVEYEYRVFEDGLRMSVLSRGNALEEVMLESADAPSWYRPTTIARMKMCPLRDWTVGEQSCGDAARSIFEEACRGLPLASGSKVGVAERFSRLVSPREDETACSDWWEDGIAPYRVATIGKVRIYLAERPTANFAGTINIQGLNQAIRGLSVLNGYWSQIRGPSVRPISSDDQAIFQRMAVELLRSPPVLLEVEKHAGWTDSLKQTPGSGSLNPRCIVTHLLAMGDWR